MTLKIKYNDMKKPMQPENINLKGLYGYAEYSSIVFDYVLHSLKKKFKDKTGLDCNVKMGPLKQGQRACEKLQDDDIDGPSDILDILRGKVLVNTVENPSENFLISKFI
ncbi:MAG: hypothetical protein K6F04_02030 [bacterium]|nr:hypothetical protein [bacterium]